MLSALLPPALIGLVIAQDILLQDDLLSEQGLAAPNSCECLDWSTVYKQWVKLPGQGNYVGGAKCGDGHEVDFIGQTLPIVEFVPGPVLAQLGPVRKDVCKYLFGRLPKDNFCVKKDWSDSSTSWCYVRPGCALGQASQGSTALQTKICKKGEDKMLSDMKFEDLVAMADKHKLEKGGLLTFAYPRFAGAVVTDVVSYWGGLATTPPGQSSAEWAADTVITSRLEAIKNSGNATTFFGSTTGHPPFGVAEGKKFYWINYDKKFQDLVNKGTEYQHLEDWNRWACVGGCKNTSLPWYGGMPKAKAPPDMFTMMVEDTESFVQTVFGAVKGFFR